MSRFIYCILVMFFLSGCGAAGKSESVHKYPRKPADTSSRKAGPAMLLYEQAEEDADVTNSVIVLPPSEKKNKAQ